MFEQATQASEAIHQSMGCKEGRLIPALRGCVSCGTVLIIAAPVLGPCISCGRDLTTVASAEALHMPAGGSRQLLVA